MNQYPVDTAVTVTIPFKDLNGATVVPTGLSYVVLDENDAIVQDETTISTFSGTGVDVTVDAVYNTIPVGKTLSYRTVVLSMTTTAGIITTKLGYLLRAAQRLVLLKNSFQTYGVAILEADAMGNLDGWNISTQIQRETALIEAFDRLTRLGYLVRWPENDLSNQNILKTTLDWAQRITPQMWPLMTTTNWDRYPEHFRTSMRRAQIAETNEILQGDVVGDKRRSGLLSESIGESSMMFRSGKPITMGLSSRTMEYLTGYIDLRMTITRT